MADPDDVMVCNVSARVESDFCSTARKFNTYDIVIKTHNQAFSRNNSNVQRRYSEFCWLKKRLQKNHPSVVTPVLPPKTILRCFNPQFLSGRAAALENFLRKCMQETLYISDSTFHLFVQSPLSCRDIDRYIQGEITEQQFISVMTKLSIQNDCSDESSMTYSIGAG